MLRLWILDDIDKYLIDWDSVLNKLEENIRVLEYYLSRHGFRIGIKAKDIFDNIQMFYPTDDPQTEYVDLTGSNSMFDHLLFSLSAKTLINAVNVL
jgi:hypothetical protein